MNWIPATKLPDEDWVIVATKDEVKEGGYDKDKGNWYDKQGNQLQVTHWMSKPQLPGESGLRMTLEQEGDLVGCEISVGGVVKTFEELDDKQHILVCNSLAQFYMMFYRCIEKGGNDD